MTRVLIIGPSHAGAVKLASDEMMKLYPSVELDFLVLPFPYLANLRLYKDNHYGARAPIADAKTLKNTLKLNGKETANLTEYDAVFWLGFTSPVTSLARMMNDFDIDGVTEHAAPQRMSFALFRAVVSEFVNHCMPDENWLNNTDLPKIYVHLRPMAAETCLDLPQPARKNKFIANHTKEFQRVKELATNRLRTKLNEHNIQMIDQPPETLTDKGLTKAAYSIGSVRLLSKRAHPENDHFHMNGAYGRLLLAALFDKIGATPQDQSIKASS